MNSAKPNNFLDIHKFPKDWGIIVFPVSMSRISNSQRPQDCIEALSGLLPKIQVNRVGANFIYSEALYMNLEEKAYETKNGFGQAVVSHMRGIRKLVQKEFRKFQIESAFHFDSWFQMYLSHEDFFKSFKKARDFYAADAQFRDYVAQDAQEQGKNLSEQQINFYLEEHTLFNLLINRQLTLSNDFVNGREQWVLLAYPGKPPRAQIYLYQSGLLKINHGRNPYKGQYDLIEKKFIDYQAVDLSVF